MRVGELLDRIRKQYVSLLLKSIEAERRDGVRVLTEVALRSHTGEPKREGVLGLPMRIDVVTVAQNTNEPETRCVSVDSKSMVRFEPLTYRWASKLTIQLRPFHWDSLTILLEHVDRTQDWRPLVNWFLKWFQEEEDGDGTPLGLVHFLGDPKPVESGVAFNLDLGSAPVEAFEELLDALSHMSVLRATVC